MKGKMKSKQMNEGQDYTNAGNAFGSACLNCCKGILTQIDRAKEAIFAEARDTLKVQNQMLRLALNEAEALAWQTLYPHLVFPALAAEKVNGVDAWNRRQQVLRKQTRSLPL
jgi:hypothetical protein